MAFPTTGVQFKHPIPSAIKPDTGVVLTDSFKPIRLQKNSTSQRQEICFMNVRVRDNGMKAWLDYIEGNINTTVNWELAGVQLFTRAATSVQVKIIDYTDPLKPEKDPLHWDMQITLLYVADQ